MLLRRRLRRHEGRCCRFDRYSYPHSIRGHLGCQIPKERASAACCRRSSTSYYGLRIPLTNRRPRAKPLAGCSLTTSRLVMPHSSRMRASSVQPFLESSLGVLLSSRSASRSHISLLILFVSNQTH